MREWQVRPHDLQRWLEVLRPSFGTFSWNEVRDPGPRLFAFSVSFRYCSLVCDTQADAEARIRNTGAGGLFGREFDELES